ncbi:MAG: B12-binding domain-containing radical SAM protein [Candidatus Pacebacteria bacterium]|nr:B12-binding domain-containing radical SAM protein [Candidatus Paceibacterota bacterium]
MESTASTAELRVKLPVVCTITPPSPFLEDERVFVSLGILRVAAVLRKNGYGVEQVDLSGIGNYLEAIRDHALVSEATYFGITATTPQLPFAVEIAKEIKRVRPKAKIILGGPHITLVSAAIKDQKRRGIPGRAMKEMEALRQEFDILVAGDGEKAILVALKGNASFIDADDPKSPLFLTSSELDGLPLPARDLVELDSYHYLIDGIRATSLIAQLGCPFPCRFCGGRDSYMLRRVRTRSADSIIFELKHLYVTYGITAFMFYDDELNVNREMVGLMRRIRALQDELGVEFRLRGFIKAELFTDEQAEAMYAAGFRWILVGFESGSPRILKNIQKKATREDNTRCMQIAHAHSLKVKALISFGHPGETPHTLRETENWLLDSDVRPDDFDIAIITCYPGAPYYDQAILDPLRKVWVYTCAENGDRLYQLDVNFTQESAFYKGRILGGYNSFVYTDGLSPGDLVAERDRVERNVRCMLGIPFSNSAAAQNYEHSMGMGLPPSILRREAARVVESVI